MPDSIKYTSPPAKFRWYARKLPSIALVTFLALTFNITSAYSIDDLKAADSLKKQILTLSGEARVEALNTLAHELMSDYPDESEKYAKQAEELARKINFLPGIASALTIRGWGCAYQDKFREADHYFKRALVVARNSGDAFALSYLYKAWAISYSFEGKYSASIIAYHKALEFARLCRSNDMIHLSLSGLASVYNQAGDRVKSIEYWKKAIGIQSGIYQTHRLAGSYADLGVIYYESGNYDSAYKYYKKAYDMSVVHCYKSVAGLYANLLSLACLGLKDFQKAIDYQYESIRISDELNISQEVCCNYKNLGCIYTEAKNFKLAKHCLDTAMTLARNNGELYYIPYIFRDYGSYYMALHEYQRALGNYFIAYDSFKTKGQKTQVLKLSQYIYKAYEKLGDSKNALKYFRIYADINSSIASENNRNLIDALEAKHLAEIEAGSLKKQIAGQTAKSDELRNFIISGSFLLVISCLIVYSRLKMYKTIMLKESRINEMYGVQEQAYSTLVTDIKNSMYPLGYNITLTQDSEVHQELLTSYDRLLAKLNSLVKHLGRKKA